MLANGLTTYESWDFKKQSIPCRSRLFPLEPAGVGTPLVESLTGYIARLAEAHCVLPGMLMERELALLLKEFPKNISLNNHSGRTGVFGHTGTLNGVGVMAADWVRALEGLTLRNDLRLLTMLTWTDVFPAKGLVRNNWAYCPGCFQEWQYKGQAIYEPLLWALKGVDICPYHHQPLLFQCLHCSQPLVPLAWRSRPGYCSECGQWLGKSLNVEPSLKGSQIAEQLQRQLMCANSIGELIAAQGSVAWIPSREKIKRAFSICIDKITQSNIAAFARLIGKPKNTVWTWQTGNAVPQLYVLAQVCYCLKISVLDFLSCDSLAKKLDDNQIISSRQISNREIYPRKNPNLNQLQETLEAIKDSEEYPPPCMEEVAKRLGYDIRYLRRHFLDLCRAISAKYIDYRKSIRLQRIEQYCQEVQQVALEIYSEGEKPTRSKVASRLSKPAYFREQNVCAALFAIQKQLGISD